MWSLRSWFFYLPTCSQASLLVPRGGVRNRQIHEDLGVPLFADHIRALTASFDSRLADVGNPLGRQLGRYLRWPRVDPVAWHESQGRQRPAVQVDYKNRFLRWSAEHLSDILTEVFPWFSLICKEMPGYRIHSRGTARTPVSKARRLRLSA